MFIRLNFAALLEVETREGRNPSLGAPRAGLALYLPSHTYYMLITAIPKPRLQGVNLVGHYTSLYFRVLCVGPSWGFGRGMEVKMRSWRTWVRSALRLTRDKWNSREERPVYSLHVLSERRERAGTGTLGQATEGSLWTTVKSRFSCWLCTLVGRCEVSRRVLSVHRSYTGSVFNTASCCCSGPKLAVLTQTNIFSSI